MTSTLLQKVERLRFVSILLVMLCAYATSNAQLSSDEISEAILLEGSVPVTWTNDAEHPWVLAQDDSGNSVMKVESTEGDKPFTSTLVFTYSSQYPTEITFDWFHVQTNSGDAISLIVDGEVLAISDWWSWSTSKAVMIPAGNHTVEFKSAFVSEHRGYYDFYDSGIRKLRVWECKELESACLKAGSLPITFENESDLDKMWITEDGYIRSIVEYKSNVSTRISTTFTVDKPSLFYYELRNHTSYSYYGISNVYVDGELFDSTDSNNWYNNSIVLYPGTHTVEFENKEVEAYSGNRTDIRNVRLDQNWYEVTLNNPGELGTRLTQVLEGKPIQDMELLKINGALNAEDWEKVKLLTGIKGIDFTETGITSIPAGSFQNLESLSTVMLPGTVKEIGASAFSGTNFNQVTVPASVESIGEQAWYRTPLRYITFAEDSKLTTIGNQAFVSTRIREFEMPNTVTTTGNEIFYGCTSLKKLHLSENLEVLADGLTSGCLSLEEVNIPPYVTAIENRAFYNTNIKRVDLPETLTSFGTQAFAGSGLESVKIPKNVTTYANSTFENCHNLKEVVLNSHCWDMYDTFVSCEALEKVVLPCATPPTVHIGSYSRFCDPFGGSINKDNITLVVPDFAFDTYRAESYWYTFKNTVKGDEASINDYWAIRGTLNLNNTLVMQGNPSVEMMGGGVLTMDSDSSQTFNQFTYNTSENTPTAVLSQSNSVKADRIVSRFYVRLADRWFFFSPVTDVKMSDVTYPSSDSWVIRYYDGARRASEDATSGNWINVPADGTLKAGQGYIIQARAAGWLNLPAASAGENDKFFGANPVTFELADNVCETEANAGWNFVANPYPTYYDIYYIDMQAPITVWDGSTYRAYSLNDGDRGDDTFVLRPMQPFFVQKNAADLTTGMPLVGRQINTTIDRSRAPRPVVVDENRHKLNLEIFCNDNEDADDYTRIVLNEEAALAYETVRDASKFMSMDAEVAQLYTLGADGIPMAINERPYEDGNVALGVLLPAADRTYRIAARRADRKAWLFDAETGIEQDLTEGDYIFSASKTGIDNKRFSIRFAPAANAVEGVDAAAVKVVGNVGSISVIAPAGASVAIYGTDGSVVATAIAENGTLEISVAGGVYVVKVDGESYKTIVK